MNVILPIPDELGERLAAEAGGDLSRRALEAFALAEYQPHRLTEFRASSAAWLCDPLRVSTASSRRAGIFLDYTPTDLRQERQTLDRLGI